MHRLIVLIFLVSSLWSKDVVKGQTVIYYFNAADTISVAYGGKTIPLLKHPTRNKRIALIPVNYRTDPGEKRVVITRNGVPHNMGLLVLEGTYPFETLRVAPSKVTPNPEQRRRIDREYREAMVIYRTYSPKRYWKTPFILPMESPVTSQFGTARLFNGTLSSYHSGTDFKAAVGTPVKAVNDGIVVLAKDRYYAGNSVIIDHGEGLYSCYYHLSGYNVEVGQTIKKGSVIGYSGQTGRVTGPHLHFAIMLHGVQVAPLQLIRMVNALFA